MLAGLNRLIAYRTFGITRGCLVRSKEISRTATKAQECLNKLQSDKWGGKSVLLESDSIKPLLAIHAIYISRADYNLSEQQIREFIHQKRLIVENRLIREILHNPIIIVEPRPIVGSHLAWIQTITDVGNSSDGNSFEKLVRKSFIQLGFSNSNPKPKASLDPNSTGGAGGIDFYCDTPYRVVGECKASKHENVPNSVTAQLIHLGVTHLGQEQFDRSIKLIFAAGALTDPANKAAIENKMNVIRPETLEKLVQLKADYEGSINLLELKECWQQEPFGVVDDQVNSYINRVQEKIKLRSHLINVVKHYLQNTGLELVGVDALHGAYVGSHPPQPLTTREMHDILIELSSPLTGYLGRNKGNDAMSDRFYFLRDLPITRPLA